MRCYEGGQSADRRENMPCHAISKDGGGVRRQSKAEVISSITPPDSQYLDNGWDIWDLPIQQQGGARYRIFDNLSLSRRVLELEEQNAKLRKKYDEAKCMFTEELSIMREIVKTILKVELAKQSRDNDDNNNNQHPEHHHSDGDENLNSVPSLPSRISLTDSLQQHQQNARFSERSLETSSPTPTPMDRMRVSNSSCPHHHTRSINASNNHCSANSDSSSHPFSLHRNERDILNNFLTESGYEGISRQDLHVWCSELLAGVPSGNMSRFGDSELFKASELFEEPPSSNEIISPQLSPASKLTSHTEKINTIAAPSPSCSTSRTFRNVPEADEKKGSSEYPSFERSLAKKLVEMRPPPGLEGLKRVSFDFTSENCHCSAGESKGNELGQRESMFARRRTRRRGRRGGRKHGNKKRFTEQTVTMVTAGEAAVEDVEAEEEQGLGLRAMMCPITRQTTMVVVDEADGFSTTSSLMSMDQSAATDKRSNEQ